MNAIKDYANKSPETENKLSKLFTYVKSMV